MGGEQSKKVELKDHPMLDPSTVIPINGQKFPLYNDQQFSRIRKFVGVSDDFINTGFSFSLKADGGNMSQGGGKGGNLLGFTDNKKYIIKELNKTDHNTLLRIAGEYADHMVHEDGSLLCKILAHFYHPERKYELLLR